MYNIVAVILYHGCGKLLLLGVAWDGEKIERDAKMYILHLMSNCKEIHIANKQRSDACH